MNNIIYSGGDERRRRRSSPKSLESKPLNLKYHNHSVKTNNCANNNINELNNINNVLEGNMVISDEVTKAKIMAHPLFPRLLTSYVNCQKVGAPSEVVARLEQVCGATTLTSSRVSEGSIGISDPALDQFMEAYCEMLSKYEQEITKPFKEAMLFLTRIESQLKALTLSSSSSSSNTIDSDGGDLAGQNGNSENVTDHDELDKELKVELLRKYSGYIGGLKQEFLKKKKNGKLPKEARKQLLDWWMRHYKWPYPSEAQKVALAEATGLEVKQINNWFINQRKRHWKPSDEMQLLVMDGQYYMDIYNNNFPNMNI